MDIAVDLESAVILLNTNTYDLIFLDHDLKYEHYMAPFDNTVISGLEGTGRDVCKYIANNGCSKQAEIIIHSLNPVGSKNMFDILRDEGYNVQCIPYLQLQKSLNVKSKKDGI